MGNIGSNETLDVNGTIELAIGQSSRLVLLSPIIRPLY